MIESGYLGVENYGRARGHVEDSEEEEEEDEEDEVKGKGKGGEKVFDKDSTVTEKDHE